MKAAFAAWEDRIAPVFDVARQMRVVEADAGQVVSETNELLADDLHVQKALRLAELGVGTLVCGAISRNLQEMVAANRIRVVPFVAGDLREVIQAWLTGRFDPTAFAMPGCCGRRRFRGTGRQEDAPHGRTAGAPGRVEIRIGAGPTGACVCPVCGQRQPHDRGVPCARIRCPKCGAPMTRERNSKGG